MTELRIDAMTFCRDFKDSGGTLALWHEIGAAVFANEMAERGQSPSDDQTNLADLCQPNPQPGGHLPDGIPEIVASSAGKPIASGSAGVRVLEKATAGMPPAREPDARLIAAMARDRRQTDAIWLARTKTSTGKYWSDVCPFEFAGMESDGHIAAVIRKVYGPFSQKQMHMTLGQLITPHIEKKIIKALERRNAA